LKGVEILLSFNRLCCTYWLSLDFIMTITKHLPLVEKVLLTALAVGTILTIMKIDSTVTRVSLLGLGVIAVALEEYGISKGHKLSSQFYNDLAWGGLTHTGAFDALGNPIETTWFQTAVPSSTDRKRIVDNITLLN